MNNSFVEPKASWEVLNTEIIRLSKKGWHVIASNEHQATLEKGRGTRHGLHLALTILTCGTWVVLWPMLTLLNRRKTITLTVDAAGKIVRVKRVVR